MGGRLIAVVGPSGAGKDSLIEALCAQRPGLHRARRVITRAAELGGEDFEAVTEQAFAARATAGEFALHWTAHGLSYAIPNAVRDVLAEGRDVLANLSRGVLHAAGDAFDEVLVLHVTASPGILARRLAQRGREQGADIDRRLARPEPAMPPVLNTVSIDNSGPLADTVATALAALYPEGH